MKSLHEILPASCDISQERNRNCSDKLVQMRFLLSVDFFGRGDFSSSEINSCPSPHSVTKLAKCSWPFADNSGCEIQQDLQLWQEIYFFRPARNGPNMSGKYRSILCCEPRGLLQESSGSLGPEVSQDCPRDCPPKTGVSEGASHEASPVERNSNTIGRFCQRVVLANVPSFRFLGSVVPFFVPSFRFSGSVVPFFIPSFRFFVVLGHSFGHRHFRGTLSGTLPGHFGPEGHERLL